MSNDNHRFDDTHWLYVEPTEWFVRYHWTYPNGGWVVLDRRGKHLCHSSSYEEMVAYARQRADVVWVSVHPNGNRFARLWHLVDPASGDLVPTQSWSTHEPIAEYLDAHLAGTPSEDRERIMDILRQYSQGQQDDAHDLLPLEVRARLPKLYSTESDPDPTVQVKYFLPGTNWTWYGIEFDGEDTFFGLVVGQDVELGYFSLSELREIRSPFGGLPVERDLYFEPTPLSKVREEHH